MWKLVETYDICHELGYDNLVAFNCDACDKVPEFLKEYKSIIGTIYVCDNETCLNIAILQKE
jgi:hypothetical protein